MDFDKDYTPFEGGKHTWILGYTMMMAGLDLLKAAVGLFGKDKEREEFADMVESMDLEPPKRVSDLGVFIESCWEKAEEFVRQKILEEEDFYEWLDECVRKKQACSKS